jgi:hypothetical protein
MVMIPGSPCDASRQGCARHRVSQPAGRVQCASHLTRGERVADRTGVAPGYPVRNIAVARDQAVRNTGRRMDGLGPEAMRAVTASHVGRGVEGVEAAATAPMEATAMKSARVKSAAVKATTAVKASTVSAAPVTATATSSLGNARERQSQNGRQYCTRKNSGERQRDAFAVPNSQHVCLHRNRRQLGGPAAPGPPRKTLWPVNKFRGETVRDACNQIEAIKSRQSN